MRSEISNAVDMVATASVSIGLFVVAWALLNAAIGPELPGPIQVATVTISNLLASDYLVGLGLPPGGMLPHVLATTQVVLLSTALGALIGIATGMASSRWSLFAAGVDPVIEVLGTIPILVLAPFFLIWFGVSATAKVILVAIYAVAVVHVYVVRAIAQINPAYLGFARTLGAKEGRALFEVIFPAALPGIFGGLRVALSSGWGLAAVAELLGSERGIGRIIVAVWPVYDIGLMMGSVLLLGLVATAVDAILFGGGRHVLLRWM